MTVSMTSRKAKFTDYSPKSEPVSAVEASSVGRKLLEKMGWEDGLGLGKNNQGMVESPLWNCRREFPNYKSGLKCKEEKIANEILPHQNAFEDFLSELNSLSGEERVNAGDSPQMNARERVQTSKKCLRYQKMARAKDISNYSVKDFKGIIGKEVTKKNLTLLSENANSNRSSNLKETNDVYVSQTNESSSEQFVMDSNSYNLQKNDSRLYVPQKHENTRVESSMFVSNESLGGCAETGNPRKRNKRQHSKSSISYEPSTLEYCSTEAVASTSAECIDNRCKELKPTKVIEFSPDISPRKKYRKIRENFENFAVYIPDDCPLLDWEPSEVECTTDMNVRNKNRKNIKENFENFSVFIQDDCPLLSSEINEKKKKKKQIKKLKESSVDSNSSNTHYSTSPCDPNLDVSQSYSKEFMCNTKSVSAIRQDSAANEVQDVSRNAVTQFDTSIRTSDKFCDLKKTYKAEKGNKFSNGSTFNDDPEENGGCKSLTFVPQINNFFLTDAERERIKKHLAEKPEILQQIANAFVGSNLMSIKGYGNW